MTPTQELGAALRTNLDEVVPPGGTDTSTAFSDTEIESLLSQANSVEEASYKGWLLKATRVYRPGRLTQARVGQESYTWASTKETFDAYMKMADMWRGRIPPGTTDEGSGSSRVLVPTVPLYSTSDDIGYTTPRYRGGSDASRLWFE